MLSRTGWSAVRDVTVGIVVCLVLATPASAGGVMDSISPPLRKLGRGLANVVTGVLEIPIKMSAMNAERGPVAAISVGFISGAGAAITRTVAGVVESVTFLFPLPRYDYGPLVMPEFLLQPDLS